jgi:predicted DNA-binding transcriptional regulator AlpA
MFNPTCDAMKTRDTPPASGPDAEIVGPLIGLPQVLALVGLGRTAWLDRVKARTAPTPIKIGRRTLWQESEVRAFIADCVRRHREGGAQ